ncbi:Phosphate acetyltransferase [Lentibacillus sp. JNUCC-1]|uniref:phosphate acetyltransferase n=1 Tax=Lentibacillus sp. JNUCC-1 TaxID=2654513 RepID=UPI0012E89280|nr:phosphate acetyltransferase [Lentibacillus sp. JNUCC-1]MUV37438.1 Phosphate acetyltransferase [Lentibacillus sp. JNUCC-1]
MENILENVTERIRGKGRSIVFPEAVDERILIAASQLSASGILQPILIGEPGEIEAKARQAGVDISTCKILDPANYDQFDEMVAEFVRLRKGKATEESAREILKSVNYFGTMLVQMGEADGLVSGATHSTADTVRPAFQIIKTKPGIQKTSGAFIMVREEEAYVFADCAINIEPDSQALAEIAIKSAETAEVFGIDPRVAMLSFSTKGSAHSEVTERIEEALAIAREKDPALVIDGELQFDAAYIPEVAELKAPNSAIQGNATVFVFPTLDAGNIAYKITQRLGKFTALGPILQGLNKPVNDLSRGCSADDVYKIAVITAAQAD